MKHLFIYRGFAILYSRFQKKRIMFATTRKWINAEAYSICVYARAKR